MKPKRKFVLLNQSHSEPDDADELGEDDEPIAYDADRV